MSENQAENESESSLPTFRPFTREELAVIENRITEKKLAAKKKAERRARNIAVRKYLFPYLPWICSEPVNCARFDQLSKGRSQGPRKH